MYKNLVEKIATYFTTPRYEKEFAGAREEYFLKTGKVFEDDPVYESRITALIEWYLFDRALENMGIPPVRLYFLIHREKSSQEDLDFLQAMQNTTHSIFEAVSRTPELLRVRDLFTEKLHTVESTPMLSTIEKGDYIDSRIFPLKTCPVFSDSYWVHPHEVQKFIFEEIERAKKRGKTRLKEKLLFDLANMKLKQDRYKHLTAEQVYSWTTFRKEKKETGKPSARAT